MITTLRMNKDFAECLANRYATMSYEQVVAHLVDDDDVVVDMFDC